MIRLIVKGSSGWNEQLKRDELWLKRCVREPSDVSRLRGRSPRLKERGGWGQTYLRCPSFMPPTPTLPRERLFGGRERTSAAVEASSVTTEHQSRRKFA